MLDVQVKVRGVGCDGSQVELSVSLAQWRELRASLAAKGVRVERAELVAGAHRASGKRSAARGAGAARA